MFYSTIHEQKNDGEKPQVADQGTGCEETGRAPIVGKLKSGEVTPLDLLDVLGESGIAEVDGPSQWRCRRFCFDRARKHAKALMQEAGGRARACSRGCRSRSRT